MPNPERTEGGLVEALREAARRTRFIGNEMMSRPLRERTMREADDVDALADQLDAWREHGPERKTCAESDDALLEWLWERVSQEEGE